MRVHIRSDIAAIVNLLETTTKAGAKSPAFPLPPIIRTARNARLCVLSGFYLCPSIYSRYKNRSCAILCPPADRPAYSAAKYNAKKRPGTHQYRAGAFLAGAFCAFFYSSSAPSASIDAPGSAFWYFCAICAGSLSAPIGCSGVIKRSPCTSFIPKKGKNSWRKIKVPGFILPCMYHFFQKLAKKKTFPFFLFWMLPPAPQLALSLSVPIPAGFCLPISNGNTFQRGSSRSKAHRKN